MKSNAIIITVIVLILGATLFFSLTSFPKEKKKDSSGTSSEPGLYQKESQDGFLLSFLVNETNASLDGEVLLNNQLQGSTKNGELRLSNLSQFPANITLRLQQFKIHYSITSAYQDVQVLRLLVSREEYARYQRYRVLSQQDAFLQTEQEHWNHMPLTYTTNFSEYADSKTREDKERKVRYALERLHNAVSSIAFQRASSEEEADINFRGEIPRKVREENRPDGDANIAALALHNVTGNIIFKATVYLPLPTEGEECPSSDVALHELLHIFGLPHSTNLKSVLWDTASCTNNEILPEDAALLKGIYG